MKRRSFLQGLLAAMALPVPYVAAAVESEPKEQSTVYTWSANGRTVTIQGTFNDKEKQQFIERTGEYTKMMDAQNKYFRKWDVQP